MVNVAVLHATLPAYLKQEPDTNAKNIEIIYSTDSLREFADASDRIEAQALVVDLSLLGEEPGSMIERIEAAYRPELTVVVYAFAKWNLIESLRTPTRHLMRAPLSARALRSSMIGLIVKQLTGPAARAPEAKTTGPHGPAPARRYNNVQLATLQDIRSVVDCECPNQVADLVLALNAFEDYSRTCQNRNKADARVHAMLARITGHARAHMEYGLRELCEFEKIDVDNLLPAANG